MCNKESCYIWEIKLNIWTTFTEGERIPDLKKDTFMWKLCSYPSSVGSWTILEMALQGKCPAGIKDKSSSACSKTDISCLVMQTHAGVGQLFNLTVWNVWFLLFLIHILSTHHPSTVTSITVGTENVASILCPPHTLKLLCLQNGKHWKHTRQLSKFSLLVMTTLSRTGF